LKEIVCSENAPKPVGPYSQGVKVGPWLFISGQIPLDPNTNQLVEGDLAIQTRRVLENIKAILDSAGYKLEDVIKVTIYLTDLSEFHKFNEVYSQYFKEWRPARTTVQVDALPRGALVEVDVVAYRDSSEQS